MKYIYVLLILLSCGSSDRNKMAELLNQKSKMEKQLKPLNDELNKWNQYDKFQKEFLDKGMLPPIEYTKQSDSLSKEIIKHSDERNMLEIRFKKLIYSIDSFQKIIGH